MGEGGGVLISHFYIYRVLFVGGKGGIIIVCLFVGEGGIIGLLGISINDVIFSLSLFTYNFIILPPIFLSSLSPQIMYTYFK